MEQWVSIAVATPDEWDGLLGEHNQSVPGAMLGLDDGDLAELAERRVVY